MSDETPEMPEMAWTEQSKALTELMAADAMRPWFEILEGWVNQARGWGYTDDQARFVVLYGLGWRSTSATGGDESAGETA